MNIQAVIGSHRTSGVSIFSKTYSIIKEEHIMGFSGFIQAISIAGDEYTNVEEGIKQKLQEVINKSIKELDFNFFSILICDYKNLRITFILNDKASDRMRTKIFSLTMEIYSRFEDKLENFKGDITNFNDEILMLIEKYFPLYYKEQFKINPNFIHYQKIKSSGRLNPLELRIMEIFESNAEFNVNFFLESILKILNHKNVDVVIQAIESLIYQDIIKPVKS